MEKLQSLKQLYRGVEFEDEMVGFLPHCTFRLNPRAASIDTPLHAMYRTNMSIMCMQMRSSLSQPPRHQRVSQKKFSVTGLAGFLGRGQATSWVYGLRSFVLRIRTLTASCLKATVCSLGRTPQRLLRYHNINNKHGHRLARFQIEGKHAFGGVKHGSLIRPTGKMLPAI